ncbi:hypothetical protein [Bradyrhizobium sp.]|jgi:hypothetical protein|uniref:hypothetical protein n=1 Tax=Bradyrhizobium sp. TaxID=376 RepID=UPI003D0BA18A
MRNRLIRQTVGAGRAGHLRFAGALVVVGVLLAGCSGGSTLTPPPDTDSPPSINDRFKQLFGSKSQAVGEASAADGIELDCPVVKIRAGASTYAVAVPGKQPVGADLRYQATITRTARDCTRSGGQITARIGIEGRVIAGPAGTPATVEIPLRVAVVQGGIQERTIATKVFRTTVSMSEGNVPFSLVGEDLVYSSPPGVTSDSYIFYIGFDPQALTPEEPAKPARKKKQG